MKVLNIYNPFNADVFHEETVASTMDVSKQFASKGEMHGTVIVADFQEEGRGRIKDRKWEMEKGDNLPFTILLRYQNFKDIPVALTLRAGLAVLLAIEDITPTLQGTIFVKWPNDIMINDKKAAGILCEVIGKDVYLGIGINVMQKNFPEHLMDKATSIIREIYDDQKIYNNLKDFRFTLLEKILARLYRELETKAGVDWKSRLEQRLYKKNEMVTFIDGIADSGKEIKGLLAGIGETGELLLIPSGQTEPHPFFTGELKYNSHIQI